MPMPPKSYRILTIVCPSLIAASIGLPAIAQTQITETPPTEVPSNAAISVIEGAEEDNIIWGQPSSTNAGSIPPEVWAVMQSQTGNSGDILGTYADIFSGGAQPEDIWAIAQSQLELPGSIEQILSNGSSAPGSIPTDVWSIMQSQVGLPGSSSSETFGSLEQIFSGGNHPFDFSSVINRDNWGISAFSNVIPTNTGNSSSASGWNPFKHLSNWIQNTPLAKAMGSWGKRIRGALGGSSFGFFTRNQVVKERDQANLFDQEIARMMAEPQLGELGERWMATEAQDAMSVLGGGLQSASAAIQIAQESQALTSTQDVAKAVAQQGGQNAALSAAVLQMQTQNQASLLQLQQLTSSAIQLSANNSEGIDEANRRERAERTNALRQSASEFIYVPNVFD
ncbi:MAG: hypothetical protein AAGE59_04200 [Cyanobacteria bacterium P01_F01_bin.86]